jgi:hypothetical protein
MGLSRKASALPRHGVGVVWWPELDPHTAVEEARAFLGFLSGASLAVPGLVGDIASDRDSLNDIGLIL